jgi:hypothetical protein
MNECHAAALSSLIVEHIRLARSRCETLGWLIVSILTAGTVTLTRLAACIDSSAQIASVHRGLERFFSPSYSRQRPTVANIVGIPGAFVF